MNDLSKHIIHASSTLRDALGILDGPDEPAGERQQRQPWQDALKALD